MNFLIEHAYKVNKVSLIIYEFHTEFDYTLKFNYLYTVLRLQSTLLFYLQPHKVFEII